MAIVAAFNAILNMVTSSNPFKGENENNWPRRTSIPTDRQGNNPHADYERYQEDIPRQQYQRPRRQQRWIVKYWRGMLKSIIGIVVIVLLAWLVLIPAYNLLHVQQVGNGQIIAMKAIATNDSLAAYKTTITYYDNGGHKQNIGPHLLRSDTLDVIVNIYQFRWLPVPAEYQLGAVNSHYSSFTQKQNNAVQPLNRSIPLQGEDNGYFSSLFNSPLVQVTTLDCRIPLTQIAASPASTYILTVQLSSDGKWICGKGN